MEEILSEALLLGVALPLGVALVLAGGIRFGFGRTTGALLASAAIAGAFVIAFSAVQGWPGFPPRSGTQKVLYVVLVGLVFGVLIDLVRGQILTRILAFLWPAGIIAWIGWRQLMSLDPISLITIALLYVASVVVMLGLQKPTGPTSNGPVMLLAASVGAGVITFVGAAASAGQLFGIIAAATGGFLLWNWPTPRFRFDAGGVLGAGGAFIAVATITILFTDADKLAMAFLILVFLSSRVSSVTQLGVRPGFGPIVTGFVALIPVLVAVAIAFAFGTD